MRFVDRSTVAAPASLVEVGGAGQTELEAARLYYSQESPAEKAYSFKAYKGEDVHLALRSLFHSKCAYCESKYEAVQPVDVEHYRPKGAIEENPGHCGYWWLAMSWKNLLPSCIDCNRRRRQTTAVEGMTLLELEESFLKGDRHASGKKDAFPTQDGVWVVAELDPDPIEQPLLIDPTREHPAQHILWPAEQDLSVAIPRGGNEPSRKGEISIHVYGLNRLGLVEARTKLLQELRARGERVKELLDHTANPELTEDARQGLIALAQKMVADIAAYAQPDQAYSTLASAFFERFKNELALEM